MTTSFDTKSYDIDRVNKGISEKIERTDLNTVVFIDLSVQNKVIVRGYSGKKKKYDFNYYFSSREKADKYITEYFQKITAQIEKKELDKKQKQEKRNAAEKLFIVGSILYCIWGYDQTNVNFYQIVERKGLKIVLREISRKSIGPKEFMSDHVLAEKDSFLTNEKPFTKLITGMSLTMDHGTLRLWDGKPKCRTWYH